MERLRSKGRRGRREAGTRASRSLSLATALLLTLVPAWAAAEGSAENPHVSAPDVTRALALEAFVWNTSPVALRTGMVFGGGLGLRQALGQGGLFLGGRFAFGSTSEATDQWNLTQLHGAATAGGGLELRAGAGLLRGELGVGAMGIRQLGRRQQYERLKAAGVTELERDGWSFGPFVFLELGASVVFYEPWRVFVQLGPGFTVQQVSGSAASRWILQSGLGVGRAF